MEGYRNKKDGRMKSFQSTSGDFFVTKPKPSVQSAGNKRGENVEKKPFDKKRWRVKQYSKKYKLDKWENKRKKVVLREYYKQIKDDEPKLDVQKIYEQYSDDEANDNENNLNMDIHINPQINPRTPQEDVNTPGTSILQSQEDHPTPNTSKAKKRQAFHKAQLEYDRIKNKKSQWQEERERKKAEKEKALEEYKKKKAEKYKKLSRKTKKGQPIMKERMELLLEEIQNSLKK